ncbi:hypothetical protein V5P93_005126 [Actinokineospora auranticolor]|uniref:Ornithine cyclodeaminase/alanine dehydrogenase-like protein (Mu-crystallin family) n=1 Tax=Actinokineospora auranticolor TaxID=155976 RepID=A0A2S6GKB1_9PSEU|nr:hypothetical protein [Actinokineospora auranticolor]PPK65657.1 ornithine cyclodeaminase/alanine dehydrogenase-like protein (mu-crystallin family) [Actinokineospora auranticolor]
MQTPTIRLGDDELRRAVEHVDAVESVAEALVARSTGRTGWTATAGSLTFGPGGAGADGEVAEFASAERGQRCALPAAGLREYRRAVLTALATRHLLAPGVVTASVIGSGPALDIQLTVLRRHVPDISHVAVATVGCPPPGRDVLDRLESAGIGLSLVDSPADAVFGANLVVLAGCARLDAPRLAKGALLVNTTGVDLPAALLDGVHEIYTDDRVAFGRSENLLTATPARGGRTRGHRGPHLAADLGQVLAGEHPGRTEHDHVLLVELLGDGAEFEALLAGHVLRAVVADGPGVPTRG